MGQISTRGDKIALNSKFKRATLENWNSEENREDYAILKNAHKCVRSFTELLNKHFRRTEMTIYGSKSAKTST